MTESFVVVDAIGYALGFHRRTAVYYSCWPDVSWICVERLENLLL